MGGSQCLILEETLGLSKEGLRTCFLPKTGPKETIALQFPRWKQFDFIRVTMSHDSLGCICPGHIPCECCPRYGQDVQLSKLSICLRYFSRILIHFGNKKYINIIQHIKRSCYQAGWVWVLSQKEITLPDPRSWGWKEIQMGLFAPLWQDVDCNIDINFIVKTCSCTSAKCKNCFCAKSNLGCLPFCVCKRKCVK